MSNPRFRRRALQGARVVVGVLAASTLLGVGPARAATEEGDVAPAALGGFTGSAASSAVHVTYNPKGLLPTGAPVDFGVPDALATIASGPSTFARASAADPGDLIANPDALLALASTSYKAGTIPAYPYRVSASSGVGEPAAESNPAPGLNARVSAKDTGSSAVATMPAASAPAVVSAGSLSANATTTTDGSTVSVHSVTKISDLSIAAVLHIDSVITDLTGTSNGGKPTFTGGTIVSGATIAGKPITIDDKGVRGTVLKLDVGKLLKQAGITITLPGRVELTGEQAGQVASTGLRIDLAASSGLVPGLNAGLDALPPIEPIAPGAPGAEDLVAAARANHLVTVELGRGIVALSASPDVPFDDSPLPETPVAPTITPSDPGFAPIGDTGSFADPVITPAPVPQGTGAAPTAPTTEPISVSVGTGIALVAALVLLFQPLLGYGLARVADVQLGTDEEGCSWERR